MNGLERLLSQSIRVRGPLSIASWMRDCLTHPQYGYYQRRPVFGSGGDFVTAVEFSAIFCTLLGLWVRSSWRQMGSPSQLSLCEFGPGRGVLMSSLLKEVARDRDMREVLVEVHLLENSLQMQRIQAAALENPQVHFHSNVTDFAAGLPQAPMLLLAHEYFDALPIYRFQHVTGRGWCEEMVDVDMAPDAQYPFRLVLSPGPTPPVAVCLGPSPPSEPSQIEVCPDAQSSMQVVAQCLKERTGAALVIDYGKFGPSSNSLRAIRDHKFVPIFEAAGECDLSADVDFRLLKNVAAKFGIASGSCLTQREFLQGRMGSEMLLVRMLERASSEDEGERIVNEYNRIIDDMGEVYKVMMFASDSKWVQDFQ